ncbi:MAG: hypothetical protein MNSN_07550 [Minisyncoccus archaeiphilus]|uniref:hypothetical protein n=1 Tax=Minisyncoccus archaeiphilus TaxID=3238481 RepID=UPI0009CFE29D|nr:MAG: hypothetical protein BWY21_01326 [Parcubacteria group bacterium ADurb.Bin216]GMX59746.1 MAG: hypothetical protein MNSN_07550 [Candidatus Parcubacteria bacterium]
MKKSYINLSLVCGMMLFLMSDVFAGAGINVYEGYVKNVGVSNRSIYLAASCNPYAEYNTFSQDIRCREAYERNNKILKMIEGFRASSDSRTLLLLDRIEAFFGKTPTVDLHIKISGNATISSGLTKKCTVETLNDPVICDEAGLLELLREGSKCTVETLNDPTICNEAGLLELLKQLGKNNLEAISVGNFVEIEGSAGFRESGGEANRVSYTEKTSWTGIPHSLNGNSLVLFGDIESSFQLSPNAKAYDINGWIKDINDVVMDSDIVKLSGKKENGVIIIDTINTLGKVTQEGSELDMRCGVGLVPVWNNGKSYCVRTGDGQCRAYEDVTNSSDCNTAGSDVRVQVEIDSQTYNSSTKSFYSRTDVRGVARKFVVSQNVRLYQRGYGNDPDELLDESVDKFISSDLLLFPVTVVGKVMGSGSQSYVMVQEMYRMPPQ